MRAKLVHAVFLVVGCLMLVLVRQMAGAGAVSLVSGACPSVVANGNSQSPAISGDGRFVGFYSDATNLVPGDVNGSHDAFVRDRVTGDVHLLNVASDGTHGNYESAHPRLSGDGRYAAFHSLASNLVPGDTNETADVFVRDLTLGITERVSVATDGAEANLGSGGQVITPDGRFVVFQTSASNLSPADPMDWTLDVYIHDRSSGVTEIVSVATDGTRPYVFESQNPSVSDDGRYVVFESRAALVPEDTDFDADVYLRDRAAGTTELINVRPDGGQSDGYSWIRLGHGISGDGRFIAFESGASDLVPGDTNGWADVFVHDRSTGTTTMVSTAPDGGPGNSVSAVGTLAGDGTSVAFSSVASNLVEGDTNGVQDIFIRELPNGPVQRLSVTEVGSQFSVGTAASSISTDGSIVAFLAAAGTPYGGQDSFTDILVNAPIACPASPSEPVSATAVPSPEPSETPPPPSEEPSPEPSETPPPPSEEPSPEPSATPMPSEGPGPAGPPDGPLVQATGTELRLEGEPYEFTGMNVYNANTRVHSCWYPFTQAQLEASFTEMGDEIDVIRAWFFQDFATTNGSRNWTAFDQTLAAAEATGKKVIVTLGNHWADCDTEGEKTAAWYGGGYAERNPALPASYRHYVAEVVSRYGDRSSILMWQLLNEAEVPLFTPEGLCDEAVAHPLLKNWAADVSALIKSIDPYHLVSIGTIGSGQCGAQYTDFKSLHDLPTVDLCEFHDYGTAVMPGDQWNGLAFRIQQCGELDKPIFVGETGITPDWLDGTLQARADLFRDKLTTQMSAGVVGEVLWAWNADGSLTNTYDIGPGDPIFAMLAGINAPDADGDGVADSIDTGGGTFANGVTLGAITDDAGHTVQVVPEGNDEVRITVAGTGAVKASFTICGFTLRLAPGSEVVVGCGSITTRVVDGAAELVLGGGLTTVSLPDGVTATLEEHPDGTFVVSEVSGGSVAVVVDGTATTVAPGQTLTVEAWDFIGFASPVDNGGVLNVVKAGTSVPLKWRLLDPSGNPVTDLATARVTVAALACSAGTSADQLEETASGASSLQNLGNGYYQLNWKTPKNYANSCKTMRLDIGDGVLHTALFQFKK